jgi:pimeloyl-ACP methyl ester carboxylesterase
MDAPHWFPHAVAERPEHGDTAVDGARIHYRAWGDPAAPGLVLVHGGAAHSGWWDHVAPFFSGRYRVVAPDISGHGDSGHRPAYDLEQWAREVLAAARAGGITGAPVVVGHSMGGWVTAMLATRHGAELDGIVIIDSPLGEQPPEEQRLRRGDVGKKRFYPDRDTIVGRFRATPPQEVLLPYVGAHIAEQSVTETAAGWTWKFDPTVFSERVLLRELLPQVTCRAGFLRAEFGLVPASVAGELDALLGHRVPFIDLPTTGHHPMLDEPLCLVTALRAVLGQWVSNDLRD